MLHFDTMSKPLEGQLYFDYPLKKLNAWRVGGNSECCYFPASIDDLSMFLKHCQETPITFLGLGSNTLVRDEGVVGVVVVLRKHLSALKRIDDTTVYAMAGATCHKLVRYCLSESLSGIEFLIGIPGTVGGALAMNAGASGQDIWAYVSSVETINSQGEVKQKKASDFKVGYRNVQKSPQEWFVAGYFCLTPTTTEENASVVQSMLKERNASQPVDQFNCGCVFKNPENDYAARLIEDCGLKGHAIGDAEVSTKHANFIINRGRATAFDIETLIAYVQSVVHEKKGVCLDLEIKIIGGPL